MMRRLSLFLFFVFFSAATYAQQDDEQWIEEQKDTAENIGLPEEAGGDTLLNTFPYRNLDDSVAAMRRQRQFAYMANLDSLLAGKKRSSEGQTIRIPAGRNSLNTGWLSFLLWGAVAFAVAFILYQLFKSKGVFQSSKQYKTEELTESAPDEISQGDYMSLMQRALQQDDHRGALRFLFLNTLQQLDKRSLINYSADKPSHSYSNELPQAMQYNFNIILKSYEYVWYGRMPVTAEQFQRLRQIHDRLLNEI